MTEPSTTQRPGMPRKARFVDTEPVGEDWRERKACRDMDPEPFFEEGVSAAALAVIEEFRAVCLACPVCARCGDYALDRGIEFGMWGALTAPERALLLDERAKADAS